MRSGVSERSRFEPSGVGESGVSRESESRVESGVIEVDQSEQSVGSGLTAAGKTEKMRHNGSAESINHCNHRTDRDRRGQLTDR